ncbi:MAG: HD domain-containing phosphohydrolase [Sulfurimonas sp.]
MSFRSKVILIIGFLFVVLNGAVYYTIEKNKNDRIDASLESHLDKLETHYEITLQHQKTIADAVYKRTIIQDDVIEIFSKAWRSKSKKERDRLREKLYNKLKFQYEIMKAKGVLQYHFVFPNNVVFLRMHKPSKYGDDLSSVRFDFRDTNEKKRINRGLSPGRTAHAFRNIYPLYDKDNNYIGALDVAFPSEVLQDSLTSINKIHTHFILNKHVFDVKAWDRDDMVLKYQPSAENSEYLLTMTKNHTKDRCITDLSEKLKSKQEYIKNSIAKGEPFSFYYKDETCLQAVAFLPIRDSISDHVIAWLVSYEQDSFIARTLQNSLIEKVLSFFVLLVLAYFIYRIVNQKEILNIEVQSKTKELQEFNQNLEKKVKDEVDKNMQIELQHSAEVENYLNKERYLRTIMSTVSDINQYLITKESLDELLQITCERFVKQHYYEFCYIGMIDEGKITKNFFSKENEFAKEFMDIVKLSSEDKFSKCPVKSSIEKNHEIIINDIKTYDIDETYREWAEHEKFTSLLAFPLKKDSYSEVLGVIVVFSSREEGFEIEEISMLEELSGDIGFAINSFRQKDEIQKLHKQMMRNYEETILGFVKLIEQRDPYTAGHTTRVAKYSKMIAEELGCKKEDIEKLYKASILHDIGKISTPDSILLKPSRLNSLEYELIQEHVTVGYEMLKNIKLYKDLAEIMHYHHERYDGKGYPNGLKGEDIPELSAIMGVADAFDAMTSTRIYKKHKSVEDALKELVELKGTQFNPRIVDIAIKVLKDVKTDTAIDQNPKTDVEVERLAYFYKDSMTGLYNENYLMLLLYQKDFKEQYKYCTLLNIGGYKDYQTLSEILKSLSIELLEQFHNVMAFRYEDDNIVLFATTQEEMELSIESVKKDPSIEKNGIGISDKAIDIQQKEFESLADLF